MARTVGVTAKVVLPQPPDKYDAKDQREMRRLLSDALQKPTDFTAVNSVPAPVSALGGLTGAADKIAYFTSAVAMALTSLTAFARSLLGAADAQTARTTLGAVLARSTISQTTASLANLASESGNIATPATVQALLQITVSAGCWVRLYTSAATQSADASRVRGVLPAPGVGVLAEFDLTTLGAATVPCSPVPVLANDEGTPQSRIFYTVQNTSGGSAAITFTLEVLPSIL